MDLPLIRELARLASVLELLKAQREVFSELSDIKEFRGLESDFGEALKVAQERRLVGQDPVSVVRADWQRMVRWSNRVQEALREADELGQELSSGLAGQGAEGGVGGHGAITIDVGGRLRSSVTTTRSERPS